MTIVVFVLEDGGGAAVCSYRTIVVLSEQSYEEHLEYTTVTRESINEM